MTKRSDIPMAFGVGAGIAGVALLAAFTRGRKSSPAAEPVASMGYAPPETDLLARYVSADCEPGFFYESRRGDILLGKGPKSITWRAVQAAARHAGFGDGSDQIADTLRRCSYAALICAAPHNRDFLSEHVGANEYRNHEGYGLDLSSRPVLWMPMLDLDLLRDCGVIAPTVYEEDNASTLEIPPELREN